MISIDSAVALAQKIGPVAWRQRYWLLAWPSWFKARGAQCAYGSDILIEYLRSTYEAAPFLSVGGETHPVVLYSNPTPHVILPDAAEVMTLYCDWKPRLSISSSEYYHYMRTAIPGHEHQTFVLKNLLTSPSLAIECGLTGYFSVLKTSDALEWELLAAMSHVSDQQLPSKDAVRSRLKLRRRLHKNVNDPLRNGDGRAAGIGVSCLLVFDTDRGAQFLLQTRGKLSQALRRGMMHTVPAGMMQAPFEDVDTECSILHCFLWEYYEELFGAKDPRPNKERMHAKWFYSKPEVQEILQFLQSGMAKMYFTGVAIDLLNLRPEVLLLLHIKDTSWFRRHSQAAPDEGGFKFNEEWASPGDSPHFRGFYRTPMVAESVDCTFERLSLSRASIAPPSAAALASGLSCFFLHQ